VQIPTVEHGLVTRMTVYQDPVVFELFSLRDESAGARR
jgi:hypothetical protein